MLSICEYQREVFDASLLIGFDCRTGGRSYMTSLPDTLQAAEGIHSYTYTLGQTSQLHAACSLAHLSNQTKGASEKQVECESGLVPDGLVMIDTDIDTDTST